VKDNGDGTFEVLYGDGDSEKAVSADMICSEAKVGQFKEEQKVEARFGGRHQWFGGIVTSANDDGTYAVRYDDGDSERSVKFLRSVGGAEGGLADAMASKAPVTGWAAAADGGELPPYESLDDQQRLVEAEALVGRKVRKFFPGYGNFEGKVLSFFTARGAIPKKYTALVSKKDASSTLIFLVEYEDGDTEEMHRDSLAKILLEVAKHKSQKKIGAQDASGGGWGLASLIRMPRAASLRSIS